MNYKNLILLISFSFLLNFTSFCQDIGQIRKNKKFEIINAQKIAFFTGKIQLTPEEAQLFWPIYNEYQNKKNKIFEERRIALVHYTQNFKTMSDKEIEEVADKFIDYKKQETSLLEEYHKKYKEILPIHKVMRVYQADNQFKNFLLQQIREGGKGLAPRRRFIP